MGIPFWLGQGFGLGVSVITDPEKQAWMGAGSQGSFGWPGAFGTWWQTDPEYDLIAIYMIQDDISLLPGSVARRAGQRPSPARAGLPLFQKAVYDLTTSRRSAAHTASPNRRTGHPQHTQPKPDKGLGAI